MSCLQFDELKYITFVLRYSGAEFNAFFLHYSGGRYTSLVKRLYCVQIDEYDFNVFFLRYSGGSKFNVFVPRGTKFYIGFSFASESQHLLPALQWVEGFSPEDQCVH